MCSVGVHSAVDTHILAERLREAAGAAAQSFGAPQRYVLFLSATDGATRATTVNASGATFTDAWAQCSEALVACCPKARWLRVDWVERSDRSTISQLRSELARTKRNYFRRGIALDEQFRHAFLETELNANAMLYGGNAIDHAVINEGNFNRYAGQRFGLKPIDFAPDAPVWLFSTGGLFLDANEAEPVVFHGVGRNAGRRDVGCLTIDQLDGVIAAGAGYLAQQVDPDGRFAYGCHPCFDRPIAAYNSLRHASTLYAMLEAWEVLRSPELHAAIERATKYLVDQLIRRVTQDGQSLAFVVEADGEIKLGASGVCLLALVKHAELFETDQHRGLLDALGCGILHMQDDENGSFTHVLNFPSLDIKQRFRIIYYDGEAAFGLMRLYGLTRDPRWLRAVQRAFRHFIRQRHWQAHDHWMGYCVNELVTHLPSEAYFRFGLRNFRKHLDFVLERVTTFPTLLELMNSAERLLARLEATPSLHPLLGEVDRTSFYEALHFRAHYLLNGHFWPEFAMFYARPDKIAGSFFIRHHAFRVRIDDVEHYLSGLIGYRKFLLERGERYPADPAKIEWRDRGETGWNARNLPLATGGAWRTPPPRNWRATGVFIHPGGFIPGRIAAVRLRENEKGVALDDLAADPVKPAAVLCSEPARIETGIPTLWVENPQQAVMDMARYARGRYTGRVIGITGSAGKTTTVAMMAHALRPFGLVGQTGHNANLPLGVAWNCASMRWDDPHIVLELGVGRMAQSAALARPDVGIFTNILPAHLEYHRTLRQIAILKSRMFLGMTRGAVAVLNREMEEWETVHAAAAQRGLTVCHYGERDGCDVRLVEYDPESATVTAQVHGTTVHYQLGAAGRHMVLNSLAVIGAASALGHHLDPLFAQLASFRPEKGRGTQSELTIDGKPVLVIDESYNANPGSMKAAIELLGATKLAGRRLAVLGEMAELGADAKAYHTALTPLIAANAIDQVFVAGELYEDFWNSLDEPRRGARAGSVKELEKIVRSSLRSGDGVLLKGSHSTGVWQIAGAWKALTAPAALPKP
jgi:UDP-N-acetylmuramoyl-tripeptide--D-alanyl-D-alanine ligase